LAIITTSSLDDTLPKFIAEAALTLLQEGLMKQRVSVVTLGKGSGITYNKPTWSAVSVLNLTQGVDLAQAQSVTDSNFAVTVAEKGGQVFFTDLSKNAIREDIMRMLGKALANAFVNSWDVDLTAVMDSATVSLGGATTTLVIGRLQAAATRLAAASRPVEGPLSCVLHPFSYYAIAQDLAAVSVSGRWVNTTGTPSIARTYGSSVAGLSERIIENFWVGKLAGVDVFTDRNIAIASSASKGGMFSKEAIVAVQYESPSTRVQRDESLRGVELNYVGTVGQGMYDGSWAFELFADASTPSV
jgi:hypothetical protein